MAIAAPAAPSSLHDWHIYRTPSDFPTHLRGYVKEHSGFAVFHHRLLVDLLPVALPCSIEDALTFRQADADTTLAKGDYAAHLLRHERAYRMDRLLELLALGEFDMAAHGDLRTAAQFWGLAAYVWMDSETDESDPIWTDILTANVPYRAFMSGPDGRRTIRDLPPVVTVYRGTFAPTKADAALLVDDGWSWSLDRGVAVKFARRFCHTPNQPFVATAEIPREAVEVCLLGRSESEVLIEPGTVTDFTLSIP